MFFVVCLSLLIVFILSDYFHFIILIFSILPKNLNSYYSFFLWSSMSLIWIRFLFYMFRVIKMIIRQLNLIWIYFISFKSYFIIVSIKSQSTWCFTSIFIKKLWILMKNLIIMLNLFSLTFIFLIFYGKIKIFLRNLKFCHFFYFYFWHNM